jgi:ArsR family transcriptional regulator
VRDEDQVLDLGCGTGALIEKLGLRSGGYIGIDYSPAMLEEAKRSCNRVNSSADLRLGALEHLPVANEVADIAVAHMVFHHISEPRIALNDMARAVRVGGRIAIVDLVKHDHEFMRERFADQWLGFDVKQFSSWLVDAGFKEISVSYLGAKESVFLISAKKE